MRVACDNILLTNFMTMMTSTMRQRVVKHLKQLSDTRIAQL